MLIQQAIIPMPRQWTHVSRTACSVEERASRWLPQSSQVTAKRSIRICKHEQRRNMLNESITDATKSSGSSSKLQGCRYHGTLPNAHLKNSNPPTWAEHHHWISIPVLQCRADYYTNVISCDNSMRAKDWRCRKRGVQPAGRSRRSDSRAAASP